MPIQTIILAATAVVAALMAGLFYSFTVSVSPGLGRLSNAEYLSAMQSINRAIQNPVFFLAFFGTLILLPVSSFMHYGLPLSNRFYLLLIATIIYFIGAFGVTVFGNIPLNNILDKFNIQSATAKTIAAQRAAFEVRWNNLNAIRTVSSAITIILVILACLAPGRIAASE